MRASTLAHRNGVAEIRELRPGAHDALFCFLTIVYATIANRVYSQTATIIMGTIEATLDSVIAKLSDKNYAESFAFYRFWFDIGQTYHRIPSDHIFNAIWESRKTSSMDPVHGKLTHPTAHLIVRFASDAESDDILAPSTSGLRDHLSKRSLQEFFSDNLMAVWHKTSNVRGGPVDNFYTNANLVARWANLGYVEEVAIRNHILQSLTSHSKLHDHQADALIILFSLAGATFGAYADPSVVDRCFELLKHHYRYNSVKMGLILVGPPCVMIIERRSPG